MTDELEALFDQISDEQKAQADTATATTDAAASGQEPSEDDLEALFDELSAENTASAENAEAAAAPETTAEQEPSEDDLEALFDELSAQPDPEVSVRFDAEIVKTDATPEAGAEEDELEALFDQLSAEAAPQGEVTGKAAASEEPAPAEQAAEETAAAPASLEDTAGKPLYDSIGGILRTLHNSMRELGYDRALQDVTTEVIDAKGRLEYVADLTEQAATRVLNSIDIAMPQQEELSRTALGLQQKWDTLFEGDMDIEAFKQLARDSREFAANTAARADEEKARLMEMMMAQDFQDITGQVIKKVVAITTRLEQELAQLLRDNAPPESKEKVVDLMSGPDVPDKAMGQDDVDGLLASLGF